MISLQKESKKTSTSKCTIYRKKNYSFPLIFTIYIYMQYIISPLVPKIKDKFLKNNLVPSPTPDIFLRENTSFYEVLCESVV